MTKIMSLLMLTTILTGCISYTENIHDTADKSIDETRDILDIGNERIDDIQMLESELTDDN